MVGEEICGAVVSVRFQVSAFENCASMWQGCKKCPVLTPPSLPRCSSGGHHLHMEQDSQRPGHDSPDTRHVTKSAQPTSQHHHGIQNPHRQHQVRVLARGVLQGACVLEQLGAQHRPWQRRSCALGLFLQTEVQTAALVASTL